MFRCCLSRVFSLFFPLYFSPIKILWKSFRKAHACTSSCARQRPRPYRSAPPPAVDHAHPSAQHPKDSQSGDKTRVRHDNAMDHVSNCDLQFMPLLRESQLVTCRRALSHADAAMLEYWVSRMLSSRRSGNGTRKCTFWLPSVCLEKHTHKIPIPHRHPKENPQLPSPSHPMPPNLYLSLAFLI